MENQWIANAYHKKKAGIIFSKHNLSNAEMDEIVEKYIEQEERKVEDRIRKGDGFVIYHTGK